MEAALSFWLGIVGLGLDFTGAAFLAYDVLYGPKARLQVSIGRIELAHAKQNRERYDPTDEIDEISGELRYWEKHERRARLMAFSGLLMLMGGFACQAVGSVLAGRALA